MSSLNLHSPSTDDHCAVSPTVPPVLDPGKTSQELLAWARSPDRIEHEFIMQDIDFEVAQELRERLHSDGLKPRFGWSGIDRVATFKIPTSMHELPACWLAMKTSQIEQHVEAVAPCGKPSVICLGRADVVLGDGWNENLMDKPRWDLRIKSADTEQISPSIYQPDQSLYIRYYDLASGMCDHTYTIPRVVLQTCCFQGVEGALNRSCDFLHNSPGNHTHAVIICQMVYLGPGKERFMARISLWTRFPTDINSYFPRDLCRLRGQEVHNLPQYPEIDEAGSNASSEQSDMSPVDPDCFYRRPQDPDGRYLIWNRTGWKVIIDETDPNDSDRPHTDFDLVLSFYDLVRVCNSEELTFLPVEAQEIKLNLRELRARLLSELRAVRGQNKVVKVVLPENREYPLVSRRTKRLLEAFKAYKEKGKIDPLSALPRD